VVTIRIGNGSHRAAGRGTIATTNAMRMPDSTKPTKTPTRTGFIASLPSGERNRRTADRLEPRALAVEDPFHFARFVDDHAEQAVRGRALPAAVELVPRVIDVVLVGLPAIGAAETRRPDHRPRIVRGLGRLARQTRNRRRIALKLPDEGRG